MVLSSLWWWSCFGAGGILCQPQQHLRPIVRPPRPLCSKESGKGRFTVGSLSLCWALSSCCSLGLSPHGEALLLPSVHPFSHAAVLGCSAPCPAVGILPLLLPPLLCPILQTQSAPSQSTWNKGAVLFSSQFPLFSYFSFGFSTIEQSRRRLGQGEVLEVDSLSTRNLRSGTRNQEEDNTDSMKPLWHKTTTGAAAPLNPGSTAGPRSRLCPACGAAEAQLGASPSPEPCPCHRYQAAFVPLWMRCPPCCCCTDSFPLPFLSDKGAGG